MKTLYITPKHPRMKWSLGIKVINNEAHPYPFHLIIKRPPKSIKEYLKQKTVRKLLKIEYVGHQEIKKHNEQYGYIHYIVMEVVHQVIKVWKRPTKELIELLPAPHFRWREGRGIWYAINDIPKLPYRYQYILIIKKNQARIIDRNEIHKEKRKQNKQPIKKLWIMKNLVIVSTF
jgi:hypothetical protein